MVKRPAFTRTSPTLHRCPRTRRDSLAVRVTTLLPALVGAIVLALAAPARAVITPAHLIDGPSADLVDVGGVAMSSDGSGGVVYRKRVDGRTHVFAAQFVDGAWRPPQRIDAGQRFDSSWPVIGAGDDGRLLVAWVQEFGDVDRVFSAGLQPGARRFEPPIPVDLNVGDSALGTYPSLSMNPGGQAYLTYRVVTDAAPATAPPGFVSGEVRLMRFNGQLWSSFGSTMNRNAAAPQSTPTALNRPRVATDVQGNAVVAWQEADDEFIDRIYARRVFGLTTGIPLQVSPSTLNDRPVRAGADAFDLDVSGFGQAAVAYRQQPSSGGPFPGPRLLVAEMPEVFAPEARTFRAPRPADGAADGALADPPGAPSVAVSEGSVLTGFGMGGTAVAVAGDSASAGDRERLDRAGSASSPDPQVELTPSGATALAWRTDSGSRGSVTARERRSDGVATDRVLTGPRGGLVSGLELSGSGVGDALVGFLQGRSAFTQIVGAAIDAAPEPFTVQTPADFTRSRRLTLRWEPAAHAIGTVRYTITIDDDSVAEDLKALRHPLDLREVEDGVRVVQVVATDSAGQETTSVPAELKLDRRGPRVRVRVRGRRIEVRVTDGARGSVSGADAESVRVRIGRRRASGRTRVVRRMTAGRHRVTVTARDRAGNSARVRRTVRVR